MLKIKNLQSSEPCKLFFALKKTWTSVEGFYCSKDCNLLLNSIKFLQKNKLDSNLVIWFGHKYILYIYCSTDWRLEDNNQLRSMYHSSYCVRPVGGVATQNVNLEIVRSGCHEFVFTAKGSLQHKNSGLCVQTRNKVCFLE